MSHPSRIEQESAAGWSAMLRLADIIQRGGAVPATSPTVVLGPGETQYGSILAECQVFCATDVSYETGYAVSGGLLFMAAGIAIGEARNAKVRRDAEAMARPQWRFAGHVPVVATNRRVLLMHEGRWVILPIDSLVAMLPSPYQWVLELHFEGENPIMLRGPWVPWLGVVLCATVYGQPYPPGSPAPLPAAPQPGPVIQGQVLPND